MACWYFVMMKRLEKLNKLNNKNFVFNVVTCCQGHRTDHYCGTLVGALFKYAQLYLKYGKYHTTNFTLKQEFE